MQHLTVGLLGETLHSFVSLQPNLNQWTRRTETNRPSHLKIPGEPKMAHAVLSRRAIDRPHVAM